MGVGAERRLAADRDVGAVLWYRSMDGALIHRAVGERSSEVCGAEKLQSREEKAPPPDIKATSLLLLSLLHELKISVGTTKSFSIRTFSKLRTKTNENISDISVFMH